MKHPILTLTALSLLAGGNLIAQTTATSPHVEAWRALKASPDFNPSSPEATAIVEAIIDQPVITKPEAVVVKQALEATGGVPAWIEIARTIADKSPFAAAAVKWADKAPEGWTPAMMDEGADYAVNTATLPTTTAEFKAQAWAILQTRPASGGLAKRFFKGYRATLPAPEQFAATRRQKDILIALPDRNEWHNAWLAEVSADLIAMQLDQR
jgi:hypothetical protein